MRKHAASKYAVVNCRILPTSGHWQWTPTSILGDNRIIFQRIFGALCYHVVWHSPTSGRPDLRGRSKYQEEADTGWLVGWVKYDFHLFPSPHVSRNQNLMYKCRGRGGRHINPNHFHHPVCTGQINPWLNAHARIGHTPTRHPSSINYSIQTGSKTCTFTLAGSAPCATGVKSLWTPPSDLILPQGTYLRSWLSVCLEAADVLSFFDVGSIMCLVCSLWFSMICNKNRDHGSHWQITGVEQQWELTFRHRWCQPWTDTSPSAPTYYTQPPHITYPDTEYLYPLYP